MAVVVAPPCPGVDEDAGLGVEGPGVGGAEVGARAVARCMNLRFMVEDDRPGMVAERLGVRYSSSKKRQTVHEKVDLN